jgi:hypothetical protein
MSERLRLTPHLRKSAVANSGPLSAYERLLRGILFRSAGASKKTAGDVDRILPELFVRAPGTGAPPAKAIPALRSDRVVNVSQLHIGGARHGERPCDALKLQRLLTGTTAYDGSAVIPHQVSVLAAVGHRVEDDIATRCHGNAYQGRFRATALRRSLRPRPVDGRACRRTIPLCQKSSVMSLLGLASRHGALPRQNVT